MRIEDRGIGRAEEHMQYDRNLLEIKGQVPLLHFYEWDQKTITYGHFIDLDATIDVTRSKALGFQIAKRPTGGGLLFHEADFSFSLFLPSSCGRISPNTAENYRAINECVITALTPYIEIAPIQLPPHACSDSRFCMASITQYDLIYKGYKIGGVAQRRTQWGLLHQTSVFSSRPDWEEIAQFVPKEAIIAMQRLSCAVILNEQPKKRIKIKQALIAIFKEWIYASENSLQTGL